MTTPAERTRAVIEMENSVMKLTEYTTRTSKNAVVPRSLLREITGWLRHYPLPLEIAMTHDKCPELWGKP